MLDRHATGPLARVWHRGAAGGAGQRAAARAAVDAAVDGWTDIYGEHGLALNLRFDDAEGILAPPSDNNATLAALSADAAPFELTLVVGELIDAGLLGVAGGIPGPLTSSGNSGIAVAALEHAGVDGELDEYETRTLGETVAHEVGHYLGLRHPVESNLGGFDLLDDTPECVDVAACEAALGNNLIYPLTVEGVRQQVVTPQQTAVLHSARASL